MADFSDVLDQARRLSESDRLRLIDALWQSVSDDSDLPLAREWEVELERRVAALKSCSAVTVPWASIRAEALSRIGHAE